MSQKTPKSPKTRVEPLLPPIAPEDMVYGMHVVYTQGKHGFTREVLAPVPLNITKAEQDEFLLGVLGAIAYGTPFPPKPREHAPAPGAAQEKEGSGAE